MLNSTSLSTRTREFMNAADVIEKAAKRLQETNTTAAPRDVVKRRSSEPSHFATRTLDNCPAVLPVRAATESPLVTDSTPLVSNSSQYLGSDEPPSGHFGDPVATPCHQRIRRGYLAWTQRISVSVYMIPIYISLMAFSCHACVMGVLHRSDCPWSENIPFLYVAMGVSSVVVQVTRTLHVLHKRYFPHWGMFCNTFAFSCGFSIFTFIYIAELIMFASNLTVPSTVGWGYCDPSFYEYLLYTNWIIPAIFFVMVLIHGPSC